MTISKRETILEYLRNTLFPLVTVASGYNYTLKTIERGQRNPASMDNSKFPALFITTSHEHRENITVNQYQASPLQVILVGYVKNSKSSPGADGTGVQQDLDKLIQDLTKVLETDRTQGNRVFKTEITDVTTDDGDMTPIGGCVISVEFKYVTEGANP